MNRTSSVTVSVLPWVAASALLCSMTVLGPDAAQAQTARDLKCIRCVDTKDVARQAINKSRIKKGAVNITRLSRGLRKHIDGRKPYYITLNGGTTATIATHGPLRYFARCLVNQPDGVGGFFDRLEIVATSSVFGWFEEDASNSSGGNPPLNAGQEVIVETETVNPSGGARYSNQSETSAVAPGGFYLALEGDSSGNGLNIFGHDCVVVGNIYRITGTP